MSNDEVLEEMNTLFDSNEEPNEDPEVVDETPEPTTELKVQRLKRNEDGTTEIVDLVMPK